ncbi:MAG: glutathione S-transferase N-terminal domain-containing protein [Polyangiales bacterium]
MATSESAFLLYGSLTSPYVRRVRIVAEELNLTYELRETASEAGHAALRQRTPIWKVPTAEIAGQLVFDSHAITELLLVRARSASFPPLAQDDIAARNLIHVADGALDALINTFNLARDGITADKASYVKKQHDRAESSLRWLEQELPASWTDDKRQLDLAEVVVGSSLAWMRFRDAYPVARHPRLLQVLDTLERRPSFANTRPVG